MNDFKDMRPPILAFLGVVCKLEAFCMHLKCFKLKWKSSTSLGQAENKFMAQNMFTDSI